MKTIEERVQEYVHRYDEYDRGNCCDIAELAYIEGATEQLEIDIKRACEYLKANIPSFRDDQLIEDFVKAMKGD